MERDPQIAVPNRKQETARALPAAYRSNLKHLSGAVSGSTHPYVLRPCQGRRFDPDSEGGTDDADGRIEPDPPDVSTRRQGRDGQSDGQNNADSARVVRTG